MPALADRLAATLEAVDAREWEEQDGHPLSDDLVDLLDTVFLDSVPMGARLLQLLEERGWTGWTKLERMDPDAR